MTGAERLQGLKMTTVFVYGSLLHGMGNHRVIAGSLRLCEDREIRTAPKYRLYSLGGFPGLVEGGSTAVLGELYVVEPATLERLDRLEGHPRFYERKMILLASEIPVASYVLPLERVEGCEEVASGDWRKFQEKR